jgi:hypothetical protein
MVFVTTARRIERQNETAISRRKINIESSVLQSTIEATEDTTGITKWALPISC